MKLHGAVERFIEHLEANGCSKHTIRSLPVRPGRAATIPRQKSTPGECRHTRFTGKVPELALRPVPPNGHRARPRCAGPAPFRASVLLRLALAVRIPEVKPREHTSCRNLFEAGSRLAERQRAEVPLAGHGSFWRGACTARQPDG